MRRILPVSRRYIPGIAFLYASGLSLLLPALASAHALVPASHLALKTSPGTLDGPALFNLVAITLVELGAIFWAAGQLWTNFVLAPAAEKHQEEQALLSRVEERFERRYSLPTLAVLLLANLAVLYGRALTLNGGQWSAAFDWHFLSTQALNGNFGTYWLMRVIVLALALLVCLFMLLTRERSRAVNHALSLLNLFLAALFFIALTMSGDATRVSALILPYSVVLDWLHLMAAALWIGSMIYILLIYLPVLRSRQLEESTRSLLAVLPQYSTLAIAGVILMAVTGPLSASFHLTSLDQFATTAYGRTLLVKILLICVLLLISAYHVYWLRPRLKKEYQKYTYHKERLAKAQGENTALQTDDAQARSAKQLSQQVKLREKRLTRKRTLMTRLLNWEPWIGVAIILCVGLLNIFAGGLTTNAAQTGQQPTAPVSSVFHGTAKTGDGRFNVALTIDPNHFGANTFTVQVTDATSGQRLGANEVSVTIFTRMLDMDMGTDSADLSPDGKGGFSGTADLSMGGNWSIQVQLRTPDQARHEANFKIYTPF